MSIFIGYKGALKRAELVCVTDIILPGRTASTLIDRYSVSTGFRFSSRE